MSNDHFQQPPDIGMEILQASRSAIASLVDAQQKAHVLGEAFRLGVQLGKLPGDVVVTSDEAVAATIDQLIAILEELPLSDDSKRNKAVLALRRLGGHLAYASTREQTAHVLDHRLYQSVFGLADQLFGDDELRVFFQVGRSIGLLYVCACMIGEECVCTDSSEAIIDFVSARELKNRLVDAGRERSSTAANVESFCIAAGDWFSLSLDELTDSTGEIPPERRRLLPQLSILAIPTHDHDVAQVQRLAEAVGRADWPGPYDRRDAASRAKGYLLLLEGVLREHLARPFFAEALLENVMPSDSVVTRASEGYLGLCFSEEDFTIRNVDYQETFSEAQYYLLKMLHEAGGNYVKTKKLVGNLKKRKRSDAESDKFSLVSQLRRRKSAELIRLGIQVAGKQNEGYCLIRRAE